ncbi:MAG: hypothetical protein WCY12_01485 [Candidatus Omnitrophota bacterium]
MKIQGLCLNCVNQGSCIYVKNGPIFFCEEFSDYAPPALMAGANNHKINQPCSCEAEEE